MNPIFRQSATTLGLLLALAASPAIAASPAANAGLDGWLALGDVSLQAAGLVLTTAYVDGISNEAGNLSGLSAVLAGDLEALAGLPQRALDLSEANYATEGSIAIRSLTVNAGDVLRFDWSFSSQDNDYPDRAFMVIGSQVLSLTTSLQAQAGLNTQVHQFALGGSYLLGVGVVDSFDFDRVSTLSISGLSVSAVPEPAAIGLWLAGLGLLAGVVRRRRFEPASRRGPGAAAAAVHSTW